MTSLAMVPIGAVVRSFFWRGGVWHGLAGFRGAESWEEDGLQATRTDDAVGLEWLA